MKFWITLFLLLAASPSWALHDYCIGDNLHCLAPSGLRLRQTPKGEVIAAMPYGGAVTVVAAEMHPDVVWDKIEGINGRWAKVAYSSMKGYVLDGFLSHLPAPDKSDTTFVLYINNNFTKVVSRYGHQAILTFTRGI